ncbi:hypothetical protein FDP41_013256 [Naegleria fowleri]|uniref:Exocyst component Exo84 C-terminal domain-containing protein n=1 Tax=Naegleria fowleri TaxID=5763 RepID=A0A6A5BRS6_NAEFO|nr:uncharacterized protein FDP41_013256 [Naegleria fowleri]KAF0980773.1 hypothetical protein FDP41_013256 [Naegleria fowleri]
MSKELIAEGVQDVKELFAEGVQDVKDKFVGGINMMNKATNMLKKKIKSEVGIAKEVNKKVISIFTGRENTDTLFSRAEHKTIETNWLSGLHMEQTKAKEKLKELVAENYVQFIEASKEVSNFMDVDMIEIGNLVSTMKNMLSQIESVDLSLAGKNLYCSFTSIDFENLREVEDSLLPQLELLTSQLMFTKAFEFVQLIEKRLESDEIVLSDLSYRFSRQELTKTFHKKKLELGNKIADAVENGYYSQQDVALLEALLGTEAAITTYLGGKNILIAEVLRKTECRGNVEDYTTRASKHIFKIIKKVAKEFKQLFKEASNTSFLIEWSFTVLDQFISTVKVQILGPSDFEIATKCISSILKQGDLLENKGMIVSFHLHKLLLPDVEKLMRKRCIEIRDEISAVASTELWHPITISSDDFISSLPEQISKLKVGKSCALFLDRLKSFIAHCSLIVSSYSFDLVTLCISELFETILSKLYAIGLSKKTSEKQFFIILSSIKYILGGILEEISAMVQLLFNQNSPLEVTLLKEKLHGVDTKLLQKYCLILAQNVVNDKIGWNSFYKTSLELQTDGISKNFKHVLFYFSKLATYISNNFEENVPEIMRMVVASMVEQLIDPESIILHWISSEPETINDKWEKALNQLILDISFLKKTLKELDLFETNTKQQMNTLVDFLRSKYNQEEKAMTDKVIQEQVDAFIKADEHLSRAITICKNLHH